MSRESMARVPFHWLPATCHLFLLRFALYTPLCPCYTCVSFAPSTSGSGATLFLAFLIFIQLSALLSASCVPPPAPTYVSQLSGLLLQVCYPGWPPTFTVFYASKLFASRPHAGAFKLLRLSNTDPALRYTPHLAAATIRSSAAFPPRASSFWFSSPPPSTAVSFYRRTFSPRAQYPSVPLFYILASWIRSFFFFFLTLCGWLPLSLNWLTFFSFPELPFFARFPCESPLSIRFFFEMNFY